MGETKRDTLRSPDLGQLDDRWDAVVIGGGPAGAVMGMLLARRRWRTLIIDKSSRGRDKCCGWCLSPRVAPLLDELGLRDVVDAISIGRTRGVRILIERCKPIELPFPKRSGWLTPRTAFDAALLHAAEGAGAQVLQNASARLTPLSHDRARVIVRQGDCQRLLQTGMIIGADGLNSAVAHAAEIGARKPGRKFGFASAWLSSASEPSACQSDGWVRMHLMKGGYLGAVQVDGRPQHLAALVSPKRGERGTASPDAFMAAMGDRFKISEAALPAPQVIAAGPMPCAARRRTAPGVALVGDAAGYVEPFTGEGMAWAIESAALLDRAVASCAAGEFTADAAARYERSWRLAIGRAQRRCAWIARALEHPPLIATAQGAGAVTSMLQRRLLGAIARPGAAA